MSIIDYIIYFNTLEYRYLRRVMPALRFAVLDFAYLILLFRFDD
jgi:hypothetical protein